MELTTDFIGRGWAFPLHTRSNGAFETLTGRANLEKAMRIVLMTYLGERPMRPAFGSRLREFVFEPVTPENAIAIAEEVARALHSCEPRVRVDNVVVTPVHDAGGRFDIDITYSELATNDEHNLVVPFYSIPGEVV
jgi:phage baseplate assembly protein W